MPSSTHDNFLKASFLRHPLSFLQDYVLNDDCTTTADIDMGTREAFICSLKGINADEAVKAALNILSIILPSRAGVPEAYSGIQKDNLYAQMNIALRTTQMIDDILLALYEAGNINAQSEAVRLIAERYPNNRNLYTSSNTVHNEYIKTFGTKAQPPFIPQPFIFPRCASELIDQFLNVTFPRILENFS